MKFNRTQNTINNIFYSVINNVVSLFLPFVLRTLIIYYLGETYVGISSLFTSILGVLNLADLGFSSAVVVSMYKPIAEDDAPTICALMRLYKNIYRVVGGIILLVGLALMPFLNVLVSGECPADLNLYVLYVLYLLSTVSGYLLFAYKQALFQAHQRMYTVQKVYIICKFVVCVLQGVAIVALQSMYLYVFLNVANNIANNLCCAYIASKEYPDYHPKGDVPKEMLRQIYKKVSGLFIQKVGQTLSTQLDAIVVSAFLGLVLLARYSNYSYVAASVGAFVLMISAAMTAGIGNYLIVETKEKIYDLFLRIQFMSAWIVGWCSICLVILYQPFMQIWVGEEMMLGDATVICLVIHFYVRYNKTIVPTFKDAAGLWWEDKWKPLVAGLVNVAVNVILVQTIGVNGVIISTIISYLFVEMPWETHVLFKYKFDRAAWQYYARHVQFLCITILAGGGTYWVCSYLPSAGILPFLLKGCICVLVPNLIFLAVYHKKEEFDSMLQLGKRILIKKR